MTPPIFNLGDEVEVIGTSAKFTITQIQQLPDDECKYSDIGMPYYRASLLRLVNEKPLSLMRVTYNYNPNDCEHGTIQVSCPCGRKAEIAVPDELKIGDYVAIVGPNRFGNSGALGHIFQITQVYHSDQPVVVWYSSEGENCYPAKSLRKLTPEEIQQHLKPKVELSQDALEKLLERLIAIEKRQDIQGDRLNTIDLEKDDLRKRLAFVEKFQRDQDDFVGRAIRDGVAEISDFRRKA